MKRRSFLKTSLAGAPLAADPSLFQVLPSDGKGFKVPAGEGRYHGHIRLKGVNENILDVKVSGRDTGGRLAVFEQTSLSPKRGTPLHVHPLQDEIFSVLEGEYTFLVGTEKYHLTAGDTIFLPRQVPHSWVQRSDRGRMTVLFQPAGKMEAFFLAVAALAEPPNPERMAQLFAQHEMSVVGPPVSVD